LILATQVSKIIPNAKSEEVRFNSENHMDIKHLPSIGGKARAKKLTKEQRQEIARKGGLAARGKPRKPYKKRKKKKI
jgi:general stress protein YciG